MIHIEVRKNIIKAEEKGLTNRETELVTQGLGAMCQLIIARPDITLEEIKKKMNLLISVPAIHKTIKEKFGFRYKKRQYMPVDEIDPTL